MIRDLLRDITLAEIVFSLLAAIVVVIAGWAFSVYYLTAFGA